MHVISMTHTIIASSDQAVMRKGNTALPRSEQYAHPPGTVLDMPDDEARDRIARGLVERYDRAVHGDDPRAKAARRPAGPSVVYMAEPESDGPRPLYRLQSVPRWDA